MLVITRKLDQSIIIELENGKTMEIKVTDIGNQVQLGITAPHEYKIWREELYETVLQNRNAANHSNINLKNFVKGLKDSEK